MLKLIIAIVVVVGCMMLFSVIIGVAYIILSIIQWKRERRRHERS